MTYSRPDLAVGYVRHTIEVDSGRPYGPGEAPGPMRRLTAALLRRVRTGFTASQLSIRDEGGVLCVALAGRELDDRPRSLEFQAANRAHGDYDPDDGYCVVDENHVPVFGGLVALRLARRTLRLRLTGDAARNLGNPVDELDGQAPPRPQEIEQLRLRLLHLFSFEDARLPAPELDLGIATPERR